METIKIEIEVPKEAQELFGGLVNIVKSIKMAMADGWDVGTDLPVVITQSLVELAPMIQGVDKLPEEFKANPAAFIKSAVLAGGNIAALFVESK